MCPNYTFIDQNTGDEETIFMSMSEHEEYTKNNPHKKQIISSPPIVDPVNIGVTRPPSDFQKYVLGRVKSSVPQADAIASKRWNIPKEI